MWIGRTRYVCVSNVTQSADVIDKRLSAATETERERVCVCVSPVKRTF